MCHPALSQASQPPAQNASSSSSTDPMPVTPSASQPAPSTAPVLPSFAAGSSQSSTSATQLPPTGLHQFSHRQEARSRWSSISDQTIITLRSLFLGSGLLPRSFFSYFTPPPPRPPRRPPPSSSLGFLSLPKSFAFLGFLWFIRIIYITHNTLSAKLRLRDSRQHVALIPSRPLRGLRLARFCRPLQDSRRVPVRLGHRSSTRRGATDQG